MTDGDRIYIGPGKTTPRLLNDLLDYDPRRRERNGTNLLADPSPHWTEGQAIPRRWDSDCRHELKKNVDRTSAPDSQDTVPDPSTKYIVSTFCSECHYYFDIVVDYTRWRDGQNPCRVSDSVNPLHHLQLIDSIDARRQPERLVRSNHKTIVEWHHFACSSPSCPVQVAIEISEPRLKMDMLAPILNAATVRARGEREIASEPTRFEGLSPLNPLQALGYLKVYINNTKSALDDSGRKRIAKRNKKFVLAFGEDCNVLFEFLGFKTIIEESPETEEGPAHFWQPPTVTLDNVAFYDDVVSELSNQIFQRPLIEKQTARQWVQYQPIPAKRDIELSLGCFYYPTKSRAIDLDSAEDHPHYLSLGTVGDFNDDYLSWAYDRQCECDPVNRPYYLDCLSGIATGRQSSDLQTKVVMATSAGEFGKQQILNSYRFFGIDPYTKEPDDHIIGLFKSRIESAPRQKDEARNCLLAIAKSRDSSAIRAVANDRTMSVEEAYEFLSVTADTAADSVEAVAVSLIFDDSDKTKVAQAMRVIANARGDHALQRTAAKLESRNPGSSLDIGEAYQRLQIKVRHSSDETVFAYYQSLMAEAGEGSKDSYREALRVIGCDRASNFLLTKLDNPDAEVLAEPSTANQPIGLDNIGNTCYLNSLLQYYYTVKPVRDVVINFENHRMSLNDEDVKKKRVGGRIVAKSEIIKAQKFVDELHSLFENLKTASTHSVKPTRELAELTIFSSAAEANFRRASISSPSGPPNLSSILNSPVYEPVYGPQLPPLPNRPSPIPEDDIEMVDHPGDKTMADDSSEATLVDMLDPPSYDDAVAKDGDKFRKEEKKEIMSALDDDAVMVNSDDTASDEKVIPMPEKQPPLPPRNKAGLVIQTNENNSLISDDELWRFGTQQDVTEVIGNVNFRLSCALEPTSIEERSGEQMDIVRDTLYGSNTIYTQKSQTLEKKLEAWANLMVFPAPDGPRDIYEALDVLFDEQTVDIDNSTAAQHASISQLPPIIHIQIQRTAFDSVRQVASKNRNAVNFPETIYLDRYMDSGKDSILMRRRRETWRWKSQLKVLEARQAALNKTIADISVTDALIATKDYVEKLQEDEILGVVVDPNLTESLDDRTLEVTEEVESISRDIAALKQNLNEQFTDMRQYEYKLQAVFIHRGESGGGHYWVYIYDFENDIWRDYNDERVTEVKDRRRIFDYQGAASETPYYLAYVRSSDRKDLVEAVCRDVPETPGVQGVDLMQTSLVNANDTELVTLSDDEDTANISSRHVEHAKPRPLRPKPTPDIVSWEAQSIASGGCDANGNPW